MCTTKTIIAIDNRGGKCLAFGLLIKCKWFFFNFNCEIRMILHGNEMVKSQFLAKSLLVINILQIYLIIFNRMLADILPLQVNIQCFNWLEWRNYKRELLQLRLLLFHHRHAHPFQNCRLMHKIFVVDLLNLSGMLNFIFI